MSIAVVNQTASATDSEVEHWLYESLEWTSSMNAETVAGKAMPALLVMVVFSCICLVAFSISSS